MTHPAQISTTKLLEDCEVTRQRRSGPGGQHRNKVETAIVIVHRPSGIRAEGTERRSQEQNRQVAILRLRVNLALEVRDATATEPTELWTSRVGGKKIQVRHDHEDFPALLANALDVITANEANTSDAANTLGISASQLIKFLKVEQRALAQVNRTRVDSGLHPLK
ncbi:MAG: protein subunit release factor B [Pirellulaceae bacterium]|jgi:protein subunit release factor B